jgi:hypothetical protein
MYQLKTLQNNANVLDFINALEDAQKKSDCLELIDICSKASGEPAKMWGEKMV